MTQGDRSQILPVAELLSECRARFQHWSFGHWTLVIAQLGNKKHVANLAKLTNLANLIPTASEVLALRIFPKLLRSLLFCLICRTFDPDVIPP